MIYKQLQASKEIFSLPTSRYILSLSTIVVKTKFSPRDFYIA